MINILLITELQVFKILCLNSHTLYTAFAIRIQVVVSESILRIVGKYLAFYFFWLQRRYSSLL